MTEGSILMPITPASGLRKHIIAVVHVKPGGQSDAAGIVVGSRLVGVNGDGVSNRPASSDNDPYRLLGVAKDADESAIR